jgi:hypothetical protein
MVNASHSDILGEGDLGQEDTRPKFTTPEPSKDENMAQSSGGTMSETLIRELFCSICTLLNMYWMFLSTHSSFHVYLQGWSEFLVG